MSDIEQAVEIINRVAWVSTDETIGNPSEVVYALRDAGLLRDSKASAAIERVRALHDRPHWCALGGGIGGSFAKVPGMSWPCPTLRALDGG